MSQHEFSIFLFGGDFLNSFESDLSRSVFSVRFLLAMVLGLFIMFTEGFGSDIYRMAHPVLCTFPYACGFMNEYKSGFIKAALPRTSIRAYIAGKFLACAVSGGLCTIIPPFVFSLFTDPEKAEFSYLLLFFSGMLWASLALTLATASANKYVAYGSSFVVCYLLVILKERYFKSLYCLDPFEWYAPTHTWIFDHVGVGILVCGITTVLFLIFDILARGKLADV